MGPEALEATLILRCNRDLWEPRRAANIIHDIMKAEKQASTSAVGTPSPTVISEILMNVDDEDSIVTGGL